MMPKTKLTLKRRPARQANGAWQTPKLFVGKYPEPFTGPTLAIDTETTALNPYVPFPGFQYAALPFCVSWCKTEPTAKGKIAIHDPDAVIGSVDPWTRNVTYTPDNLVRLLAILEENDHWLFHNALFDLKMLAALARHIGGKFATRLLALLDARVRQDAIEDSLGAAHVLDSQESHGLKQLCVRYLDICDEDQSILLAQVARARDIARSQDPPIPVAPKAEADFWLPSYINPHDQSLRTYGLRDPWRTVRLWLMQRSALVKEGLWPNYVRERKSMLATHRMQSNPIHLNPKIHQIREGYVSRRDGAENTILELAGDPNLNLRSTAQLANLLHRQFGLPILTARNKPNKQWPEGAPCVDKNAIPELCDYAQSNGMHDAAEILETMLEYRKMNTGCNFLDQYLEVSIIGNKAIPGYGRPIWLYGNFNPWGIAEHGLRTTRFSANGPNLTAVGRPDDEYDINLREAFGPQPGWAWVAVDFNQLELRIMSRLSGDPTLTKILAEGLDQHQITTDAVNLLRCGLSYWPQVKHPEVLQAWKTRVKTVLGTSAQNGYRFPPIVRRIGKNIGFAWTYGAGVKKLSLMAGVPAEALGEALAGTYPGVVSYMHDASAFAKRHGYIKTLFGYRLFVEKSDSFKATNYSDQGTAGDLLKSSMIAIYEYIDEQGLQDEIKMLMVIHDEIILAKRKKTAVAHIKNICEIMGSAGDAINCPTPVEASIIRKNWGHKEKLEFGSGVVA